MPPRKARVASKLSDPIAQRIRDAEKKLSPVKSDRIGYDEGTYVKIADIVESGRIGKKFEVLREALRTGIDVLHGELSMSIGGPVPMNTANLPAVARDVYAAAPLPPDDEQLALPIDDDDLAEPAAPPGFIFRPGIGYVPGIANEEDEDEDAAT
jgi:hypothetical protein